MRFWCCPCLQSLGSLHSVAAVGTVCFDHRIGLLSGDNNDNEEGETFIQAVHECLTLTQKELKLIPLYRILPTPVFERFSAAQRVIRR